MSLAHQILPSDKNEIEYYTDLSEDGEFEITLPLTDASRRQRRLTLLHFQTQGPFVPGNVQKLYDSTSNDGTLSSEKKFYVLDIDCNEMYKSEILKLTSSDIIANKKWENKNLMWALYKQTPMTDGLLFNGYYLQNLLENFYEKTMYSSTDFTNMIQVFAEIGTKVSQSDINAKDFDIKNLKLDEMKIFWYPVDFYYPLVTQIDHGSGGTEIDIGTIPSFNFDEALRSMLRYTLITLNKGDVRSVFTESKRSVYLEYEVADPNDPDKVITKYLFVWTLGNPIFFDCANDPVDRYFRYMNFVDCQPNRKKSTTYGREGTYVNFVSLNSVTKSGFNYSTYLLNFFQDMGFNMTAVVPGYEGKENCLMNLLRTNWGFVVASSILYKMKNANEVLEPMPTKLINLKGGKMYNYRKRMPTDLNVFNLYYGSFGKETDISSVTIFNRPSNITFYGADIVLRLLCDQVETIVYGNKKRKRLAQVLATLVANEQTYQTFNGVDNRIVIQPPTFKPLLLQQQEQSLIVGSSNRNLRFFLLNADDEIVKFASGEKVYIKFRLDPV